MREGELINLIFTNAPRFIVSDLILRVRGRGRRGGGAQGPGCGEPASKGTMRELRSAHRLTRPQRPPGLEMRQNPGRSASVRPGAVGGGQGNPWGDTGRSGPGTCHSSSQTGGDPLVDQAIDQSAVGRNGPCPHGGHPVQRGAESEGWRR